MHNTILQRVISRCKNNKPLKMEKRPAPAPYFHPSFSFSDFPFPSGEVIKIYSFPLKKGGPNYASAQSPCQNENFVNTSKKVLKNSNYTFPVVHYFT